MDYHSLKRKELQSLCKKNNIPANLTNFVMADRLTSLLKGKDEFLTGKKSSMKTLEVNGSENEPDVENKRVKKVRFSPETQTFEFQKADAKKLEKNRPGRQKSVTNEVSIQKPELSDGMGDVQRTRRQGKRDVKDDALGHNSPSVDAHNGEDRVVTRRSLRIREVVDEKKGKNEDEENVMKKKGSKRQGNVKGSDIDDVVERGEADVEFVEAQVEKGLRRSKRNVKNMGDCKPLNNEMVTRGRPLRKVAMEVREGSCPSGLEIDVGKEEKEGFLVTSADLVFNCEKKTRKRRRDPAVEEEAVKIDRITIDLTIEGSSHRSEKALGKVSQKGKRRSKKQTEKIEISVNEVLTSKERSDIAVVDNSKQQRKRSRKNTGWKSRSKDQDNLMGNNGEITASDSADLKIHELEPIEQEAAEQEGSCVPIDPSNSTEFKGIEIQVQLPVCKPTLSGPFSPDHIVEDEQISSETNAANSEDAMTAMVSVAEELTAKELPDIDFAESNVSKYSDNEGFVDNLKQQRKRCRKNSGRKSHPKDQDSCLTGVNGENTASHSTDLKIDDIEPGTETFHNQTVATEQEGCGDVVSSEKLSMEDLKGTYIWIELPICKPTLSGPASLDHVVEDEQISSEKNAANSEDAMSAVVSAYENLRKVANPDNNDYPSSSLSSGSALDQIDPSLSMLAKSCEADTVSEQGHSDHEELKCTESARYYEHNHTQNNCHAFDKCCENTIIEPSSTAPCMLEDGNVNGGEDLKDTADMLGKDLVSPLRAANAVEANCTQLESTIIPIDFILTLDDSVSGTFVKSRQSFFQDTMVEIQERSGDEMERHSEPTNSDDLAKAEKQSGISQDLVLVARDFAQQTIEDEANSSVNLEIEIEKKVQSPLRRQNGCEAANVAEVDRNYAQVELKCDELSKSADYKLLAEQCHTTEESFIPVSPIRSAGSMLPDEFVDPEDSAKHLKNDVGSKKRNEDGLDKDGNDGFIQSYTSAEKENYYEDNPVNSKTGNFLDVYNEKFSCPMNLDILLEKGEHSLTVNKNDSETDAVVEVDQNDDQVELNHDGLSESVKDTPVEESYQSPNKCSEYSVRSILQDGEDSMECQKSTIKSRKTFEDEPGKDGITGFTHSCITQKFILAENYNNCEGVPVNAEDPMEAMITGSGDFANIPLVDKNDMAPDQREQSPVQQMNGIDAVNVAEEDRGHEELKCTESADDQNATNENCDASDKCCESDAIEAFRTLTCMLEEGNVNGVEDSKDSAGLLGKGFVSPLRAGNAMETNSLSSGSAELDKDENDGFTQSNTSAKKEYYCEENPLNSRTDNFLDVYNEEFTSSMNLDISLEKVEHSLIVHKNGSEADSVAKVHGNDDQVEPKYDGLSEFVKDTPLEENYESPNKCSESNGRRTLQDGEDSMECQKNTITSKKTYENEPRKDGNTDLTNSCITEKFILAENYDICKDVPVNAEDPMEQVIFETDKFANIPLVDNNNDMAPDQREQSPIQLINGVDAVNITEEDRGQGQVELYCDESAEFVEDRCLEERHHSPYKCLASIVSASSGRTSSKTLKVEIVSNSEDSIKHLEESYEDATEEDGGAGSIESETYTASQNHEDSLKNSMNAMEAIISTAENIAHISVAHNDESTNSLNLDVMIEEREKSSLMHRDGCQAGSVENDELDKDENDGFIPTYTSAKNENYREDNPMNSRTDNFRDVCNEELPSSMNLDISLEKGEPSPIVGSEAGSKFILRENCDNCEEVPVNAEGQMEEVISGTGGFANIALVDNNDMAPDQREESPILQMNGVDSVNVAEEDRGDGQVDLYCDESAEFVEDRCLEERHHSPNKCLTSIVSDSSGGRTSRILLDKIVSGSQDSIKHREKTYNDAPEEDGGAGSVESYVIDKYTTTKNHEGSPKNSKDAMEAIIPTAENFTLNKEDDISTMNSGITLEQREQSAALQKHGWEKDNVAEDGNCEDKELGCDEFTKSVEDRPFTERNCSSTEFSADICNIGITNLLDCNPTTDDPEEIVDATDQLPSAPRNSFVAHDVSGACKKSEDVASFESGFNVEDVVEATKSQEVVLDVQSCKNFEPLIEESKNTAIEIKNADVMADEKTFHDKSEMAKRNRCRSILIHGTPRKLEIAAADMKENMLNSKMEKLGSLTTVKPATKRPALKDLVQK